MRFIKISIQLFFIFSYLSSNIVSAKTKVSKLVCEYKINPIGIDIERPRFSWQILSEESNIKQIAYEIRVADSRNNFNNRNNIIWSSGRVISDQSVNIDYQGLLLKSIQRAYWQVRIWDNNHNVTLWSEPAFWETGILDNKLWTASWICMKNEKKTTISQPCKYFRKEFMTSKKVSSARVYVTSLGLYQLFLNGNKIGNDLFTPGWTSYKKRLQYQTYDVSTMLKHKNTISAIVGDGWFLGNISGQGRSYYGDQLALLALLKINYTDGTSESIVTDNNWKVSYGPILESDIYNGEKYDARLEMNGWSANSFDDSKWQNVDILEHTKNILIASQGEPVQIISEIIPKKVITTPKGETVLDMGQNMVGWIRLKIKGEKGDELNIQFAEVLDKDGNFYTDNLRKAKATDIYILKGTEEEIFEPHFTFHGFRYLKIIGLRYKPQIGQVAGMVIHTKMAPTGTFSCSDSLINKLQHNIQWGQKGNFLDVPTDCPQRDERLGWTGDAQVFSMTAAFNFNVAAFYTKWLKDLSADQGSDGKVTNVVPDLSNGEGGATAWADAAIIIPWTLYRTYGDKRILKEQYSSMKAWIEFMNLRAGDDYLWIGDPHFGDWLAFNSNSPDYSGAFTEKDLIANAYNYYSTNLFGKIASIIGQTNDALKYQQIATKIKKAFIAEFTTPNGRLISHTQTAYALALSFGLLPDEMIPKSSKFFADDVNKFKHLTTGFVGTPLLCSSLSSIGRDDLAFMLLTRKEYPSWLYPVTQGATTIWERWDGQKPDGTFQTTDMNSFNHYAYGAIGEWLYSYVAGISIDPENPGYKHILFNPHPGGGLKNAKAEFKSMYGLVKSAWRFNGDNFVYEIEIPSNTTATVTLPQAKSDYQIINLLTLKPEMRKLMEQNTYGIRLKLGSGKYQFSYPAKY